MKFKTRFSTSVKRMDRASLRRGIQPTSISNNSQSRTHILQEACRQHEGCSIIYWVRHLVDILTVSSVLSYISKQCEGCLVWFNLWLILVYTFGGVNTNYSFLKDIKKMNWVSVPTIFANCSWSEMSFAVPEVNRSFFPFSSKIFYAWIRRRTSS